MQSLEEYKHDYLKKGFISPVRIISAGEAKKHRDLLENSEKIMGDMHYQSKLHTMFKSAYDLAVHPNILDIVEFGKLDIDWLTRLDAIVSLLRQAVLVIGFQHLIGCHIIHSR